MKRLKDKSIIHISFCKHIYVHIHIYKFIENIICYSDQRFLFAKVSKYFCGRHMSPGKIHHLLDSIYKFHLVWRYKWWRFGVLKAKTKPMYSIYSMKTNNCIESPGIDKSSKLKICRLLVRDSTGVIYLGKAMIQ